MSAISNLYLFCMEATQRAYKKPAGHIFTVQDKRAIVEEVARLGLNDKQFGNIFRDKGHGTAFVNLWRGRLPHWQRDYRLGKLGNKPSQPEGVATLVKSAKERAMADLEVLITTCVRRIAELEGSRAQIDKELDSLRKEVVAANAATRRISEVL